MISRSGNRYGGGSAGGVNGGGGERNMKFETHVVEFSEQRDKNRVALMVFGRPGIYYASLGDAKLVAELKKSKEKGTSLSVEVDPDLNILSASPSK